MGLGFRVWVGAWGWGLRFRAQGLEAKGLEGLRTGAGKQGAHKHES